MEVPQQDKNRITTGCNNSCPRIHPKELKTGVEANAHTASSMQHCSPQPRGGGSSNVHRWWTDKMCVSTQSISLEKEGNSGTSLVVQWLRCHTAKAEGPGLIPGQRTGSHVLQQRVHMPRLRAGVLQQERSHLLLWRSKPCM